MHHGLKLSKPISVLLLLTMTLSMLLIGCQKSNKNVVNVFNWGLYIDEDIFKTFENQTGIRVNYQTYDSNEMLYSKIKGGGASYDVIIPSDYMVSRMISEDMLEKLDYTNIPNISKIDDNYRYQPYDPDNAYTVPYMWGTVGLIYNSTVVTEDVNSWGLLFDEKYAGRILMFDNSRDAMGIALLYLGYSINTTDKSELDEAYDLLKRQKPLLYAYTMDQIYDWLEGGEAAIGPYYAGDYITMIENNPDLKFCLPDEGSNVFIDCMCIPKGAKNKANAEAFINFMCDTEIALLNCAETGYSTPSKEAYDELPDETKNNTVMYPSAETLDRCEAYVNLPREILEYYDNLWVNLKT
ncbi:MAG: spermidine/putrescine ABC transporter substrate-binding protein [Clostridiales bacterium]|nr:spermidine/putrescine ABC transporter substrate-binding protein [Clostridiales bacterium]